MRGELLVLGGCATTPLASYLKALGVLRLISSADNHVSGGAADPQARGWWENERFCLRTALNRDRLLKFLLHDYAPSPIVAPWNGGSGFYPGDNRDGFGPLSANEVAERFAPISSAIRCSSSMIADFALSQRPQGAAKLHLVAALRSRLPEMALRWLDAVLALSGGGIAYPELLGTGGNDGRLDFTNNFARRLVSQKRPTGVFDAATGCPADDSEELLAGSLFGVPVAGLSSAAVGQFSPGAAGGPNGTTGYTSGSEVNAWDYVLTLEGSVMFAGAATRRHERSFAVGASAATTRSGASFPFTVRTIGAGWGGVEAADESDARAEFWAPLWNRPARSVEIESLLGEGRAVLNARTARDGLDFARAAASLGVSRGFSEFERYGFLMRSGKSYLATPIGRRPAAPSPATSLIADLDQGGWLTRVRRIARGDQPSAARRAVKRLEDAIFELTASAATAAAVERAVVALGRVSDWLSLSPKGRQAVPAPPPVLSGAWVLQADDGSAEFRIAAALATVGLPPLDARPGSELKVEGMTEPESLAVEKALDGPVGAIGTRRPAPPMAAHFSPLDEERFFYRGRLGVRRGWSGTDAPRSVVWGSGPLVPNMIAVLERRLLEASIRGLEDKPLAAATPARLADVAAFLAGDFDDARCAALVAGLVWARPAHWTSSGGQAHRRPVPFAYAALKPVFSPDRTLQAVGALAGTARMPVPPGLVARLRAGANRRDGRVTGAAVGLAMARARASGMTTPFDPARSSGRHAALDVGRTGAGVAADRLAAALLIPIGDGALTQLIRRAYPGTLPENDNVTIGNDLEDEPHAV